MFVWYVADMWIKECDSKQYEGHALVCLALCGLTGLQCPVDDMRFRVLVRVGAFGPFFLTLVV
jgi:hypothetical protein